MENSVMGKLLDVLAVARRYCRSRRTIYRWIHEGKMLQPTVTIPGAKRIRFWSEEALEEWEASGSTRQSKQRCTEVTTEP